jgi:hypothetical protein
VSSVAADGVARALCALHFEWDAPSPGTMYVSATVSYKPGAAMAGKLGVTGGIEKWQVGGRE